MKSFLVGSAKFGFATIAFCTTLFFLGEKALERFPSVQIGTPVKQPVAVSTPAATPVTLASTHTDPESGSTLEVYEEEPAAPSLLTQVRFEAWEAMASVLFNFWVDMGALAVALVTGTAVAVAKTETLRKSFVARREVKRAGRELAKMDRYKQVIAAAEAAEKRKGSLLPPAKSQA